MSIIKSRYSEAREAAAPTLEDYQPTTMDVFKLEIACVKGNKWLDADEKRDKYKLLKRDLAPNMPEHVFEALLK